MIFFEALGFATLVALIVLGLGAFIHYISDYNMSVIYGLSLGVWFSNFIMYLIKSTQ